MSEQKKAEPMTEAQTAEAEQKLADIPSVSGHEFRKYLLWTWAECYGLRLLATIRALQGEVRGTSNVVAERTARLERAEKERDDARAEVERLRAAFMGVRTWAERGWDTEVKYRPTKNVFRAMLDTTWRRFVQKMDEVLNGEVVSGA